MSPLIHLGFSRKFMFAVLVMINLWDDHLRKDTVWLTVLKVLVYFWFTLCFGAVVKCVAKLFTCWLCHEKVRAGHQGPTVPPMDMLQVTWGSPCHSRLPPLGSTAFQECHPWAQAVNAYTFVFIQTTAVAYFQKMETKCILDIARLKQSCWPKTYLGGMNSKDLGIK